MINRSDYNSLPAKARYSMIIGNLLSLAIALAILISVWKILHIFPIPKPVFFWYKWRPGYSQYNPPPGPRTKPWLQEAPV